VAHFLCGTKASPGKTLGIRRANAGPTEKPESRFPATDLLLNVLALAAMLQFSDWLRGSASMPVLSTFYGIVVSMYFMDNRRHHPPHVHARYQDDEAVLSIPEGELLEGGRPPGKLRLVQAWVEIHKDELMADWELAAGGQQPFKIEPLR
jgi:hypothetical protein